MGPVFDLQKYPRELIEQLVEKPGNLYRNSGVRSNRRNAVLFINERLEICACFYKQLMFFPVIGFRNTGEKKYRIF